MPASIPHPEMILCVPGPWRGQEMLAAQIQALDAGYEAFGLILMHTASGFGCDLELHGGKRKLREAFAAAGPHWRDTPAMAAIASHKSRAYLYGYGGSPENAGAMMKAAAVLVRAGGLGVMVESSGIAHAPEDWLAWTDTLHLDAAHEALVVYVKGEETCSCGMHNFGLKDAIVASNGNQADAAELLRAFTHYMLTEDPALRDGQTYSAGDDAPVYIVRSHPGIEHGAGSLFTNPYGAWYLAPRASGGVH